MSFPSARGGNAVGVLTALAFVAFLFAYAIFGQRAAGIAFWSVFFGLPVTVLLVAGLGTVSARMRREQMLEIATLAAEAALTRRAETAMKSGASLSAAGPAGTNSPGSEREGR